MNTNVYIVQSFLVYFCLPFTSSSLLCYNCSSTHRSWDWDQCGGQFTYPVLKFNDTRHYLINCTGDNSMCFVRSWAARSKHSWIVQRGCYQSESDDPFPRAMDTPTRAMTCKRERLADAEYKVCLCNANWCNSALNPNPEINSNIILIFMSLSLFYK